MKLDPYRHETVVIDPRSVADNAVGDNAWCQDEFEEEEEEESEEDQEEDDQDAEDIEGSLDEENTAQEEQEKNHPATTKPVDVARAPSPASPLTKPAQVGTRPPSPGFRRQPGAHKNAIIAELDEDAIARQLLEFIAFAPPTPK